MPLPPLVLFAGDELGDDGGVSCGGNGKSSRVEASGMTDGSRPVSASLSTKSLMLFGMSAGVEVSLFFTGLSNLTVADLPVGFGGEKIKD